MVKDNPVPVKITINGKRGAKISIPDEILEAMGVSIGERLTLTPCGNGAVILQKLAKA